MDNGQLLGLKNKPLSDDVKEKIEKSFHCQLLTIHSQLITPQDEVLYALCLQGRQCGVCCGSRVLLFKSL